MAANKRFNIILIFSLVLNSCNSSSTNKPDNTGDIVSKFNSNTNSSKDKTAPAENDMFDSTKLKSDLNEMINSITSGDPDTTKLKNAAAGILSTDAAILSDSGIAKMYGNSTDPSIAAAKNMLKNMRDKMGITPGKLDSIKKAAAQLKGTLH